MADHPLRLNQRHDLEPTYRQPPGLVHARRLTHDRHEWRGFVTEPYCRHPNEESESRLYHGVHDWHIHGNLDREDDYPPF